MDLVLAVVQNVSRKDTFWRIFSGFFISLLFTYQAFQPFTQVYELKWAEYSYFMEYILKINLKYTSK